MNYLDMIKSSNNNELKEETIPTTTQQGFISLRFQTIYSNAL